MKRMIALVSILLLMLTGCAEPEQVAAPDIATAEPLEFRFETPGGFAPHDYYETAPLAEALGGEVAADQTVLIRVDSAEELAAFEQKASGLLKVEYGLLQNSTGRFYRELEGFFDEYTLLLIHQTTPTGMAVCWVEGVERRGDVITITVKMGIPQPCNEDVGACLMAAELPKGELENCAIKVAVERQLVAVC